MSLHVVSKNHATHSGSTSSPADITGWDSLAHMEFVVAIEAEFGIVLSALDIMGLTRLDKALPLVQP